MEKNASCVTVHLLRFACNDNAGEGKKCLPYLHLPCGLSRDSELSFTYFIQGLYALKCVDVVLWCVHFDNNHKKDDSLSW